MMTYTIGRYMFINRVFVPKMDLTVEAEWGLQAQIQDGGAGAQGSLLQGRASDRLFNKGIAKASELLGQCDVILTDATATDALLCTMVLNVNEQIGLKEKMPRNCFKYPRLGFLKPTPRHVRWSIVQTSTRVTP